MEALKKDLYALSGDLDRLESYLKGDKQAQSWYFSELEDMIIKKHGSRSEEIQLLNRVKGEDIVSQRRTFLEQQ